MPITAEEAGRVVARVHERATELGAEVTVAIVDEGGGLQALGRMDAAAPLSVRIAEAKAATVAVLRRDSAALRQMQASYPSFFGQLDAVSRHPILVGAGAVLIRRGGQVLGALAVSGGAPEQDDDCAAAGLELLESARP